METMVSSPFARLVEGKKTDNLQNWHVEHAGSQGVVSVGWVNNSSAENVESSGEMENGADDCAWMAHPVASVPSATVAAAAALQSAGDYGQPPSTSSLTAP